MRVEDEEKVRKLIRETVQKAAREAVDQVFHHLDIDLADPREVKRFKADLAYVRKFRRGAETVSDTAIKTCVGALVAGTIALVVAGLVAWINDKLHRGG